MGGFVFYDILFVIVNLRCERWDGEEYVVKINFCLLFICIFVRIYNFGEEWNGVKWFFFRKDFFYWFIFFVYFIIWLINMIGNRRFVNLFKFK